MNKSKTHSLARAHRASAQLFSQLATALTTALALIALAAPATSTRAQTAPPAAAPALAATGTDAPIQLEAYVVSASRTEQNIKLTPSSVTSLALSELRRIQIPDLRAALQMTPGVNIIQTGGGAGSQSTISIRGAGPNQTLFLIDGIRMNTDDWTSDYRNFLGAAGLAGLDRVEILRGPQSTLYGSAAMGGVVSLETARGRGPAAGFVALEGGSFNSIAASIAVAGSAPLTSPVSAAPQTLSYSAALTAAYTENDRDFNLARQLSGSTRIEYQLANRLTAGFTYRGLKSHYDEPSAVDTPEYAGILDLDINIATAYLDWKPLSTFDSRLTCGWVQNIYDWVNRDGTWPSNAHSTRNVLDWQNTWQALEQLQLIAGLNAEWSSYNSSGNTQSERLSSLYLNAAYTPLKNLHLTAGARIDDYNTLDTTRATVRAGAAYRIEQSKTTLRATYGTGFNAPSPRYTLGDAQNGGYYAPSPGLKPEKSKGWDIGIEQDLWRDRITLGAACFRNDFADKFAWKNYPYETYNIPDATTKGVETYIYTRPVDGLNIQFTHTYLDTRDNNGARLVRMPRHSLTADANYQITKDFLVGAGITHVAGRPDEVYKTLYDYDPIANKVISIPLTKKMPDYTIARAYASYALPRGIKLKLRVENLLDKKYETIAGYPALPLGVFGGIEWRF